MNFLIFSVKRLIVYLTFGASLFLPQSYAEDVFFINNAASKHDQRYQYSYELLELIIEATNSDFGEGSMQISNIVMSRNRTFRELQEGGNVNVVAEAANSLWNEKLIPIMIPIRRGIQGFRLFIIKQENQAILADITTLTQLMSLETGSGSQWSTKVAMQQAGFEVIESTQYDSLFNMLSKGRFVTFGRGVNEVFLEIKRFKQYYPDFVVDEYIALHIPLATYYYVSPSKPRLAKRIKIGLQRIIDNGQFEQLFYRHHCDSLLASKLNERRIFKINNPHVSEVQMASIVGEAFLLNPQDDFSILCQKYR
ncbi:hypothetical protein [Shewanella psychrotolerans]|uniref:hypothetical protein n=1 Tax=Shewanella psychrotolerans TaxID=2864206 RepID=UPI001C65E88B|nr:hypothetical protein [Shewanella psychrotolerans]QYK01482.1 hypothetical protein K0I62_00315 [Shewanella psychrotolerans]